MNSEQHSKVEAIKAKMYTQGSVGRARDYDVDVKFLIDLVEELSFQSVKNEECTCECAALREDLKALVNKHRLASNATAW